MKRHTGILVILALAAAALLAGCWGSSKSTSLGLGTVTEPARVGSAQCTNTCHAATQDVTGTAIAEAWAATTHTTVGNVQCEDCHGGGGEHWGTGPIPHPNPQAAQCNACHGFTAFEATMHANAVPYPGIGGVFTGPAADFLTAPIGDGSGQAVYSGSPEFRPDNVTPVTKGEHIEQCSRCHNPNQRFAYGAGKVLLKPLPGSLPTPAVSCASCHDAHQPESMATVAQRTAPVPYPNFRKFVVDNDAASGTFGAQKTGGVSFAAAIFQPNGAVKANGSVDNASVIAGDGKSNELHPDRLCASCHAKGKYQYSGLDTHQDNIYGEWMNSGHAERSAPAFGEFSANPPVYDPEFTAGAGSHQTLYPFDMKQGSTTGGAGRNGATATTNQNAAVPSTTGFNDNYRCFKCHNGLASLDYQDDVQGTANAHVIFGDVTVTCVTCHDPHADAAGQTKNTRRPVVMTKYTATQVTFSGNVFLDNTPVDLARTGNGTICVFCHQGRESGFTVYKVRNFATAVNDNLAGASFTNPHYLGAGAMLWGKNAYEYAGKSYGGSEAHQGANCITCHMGNPTDDASLGGHTWKPNVASCNAAACHGGAVLPAMGDTGGGEPDVENYRTSTDTNNYTGLPGGETQAICQSIRTLQDNVIALLAARGIYYDDTVYPYFHNVAITVPDGTASNHTSSTAFTGWTKKTYRAAFNLQFIVKGLPSEGTSTTYVVNGGGVRVPDTSATLVSNHPASVHNFRYVIQLLRDAIEDLTGTAPGGVRPTGNLRPATVYGPGQ